MGELDLDHLLLSARGLYSVDNAKKQDSQSGHCSFDTSDPKAAPIRLSKLDQLQLANRSALSTAFLATLQQRCLEGFMSRLYSAVCRPQPGLRVRINYYRLERDESEEEQMVSDAVELGQGTVKEIKRYLNNRLFEMFDRDLRSMSVVTAKVPEMKLVLAFEASPADCRLQLRLLHSETFEEQLLRQSARRALVASTHQALGLLGHLELPCTFDALRQAVGAASGLGVN